jgi:hypothetical protein
MDFLVWMAGAAIIFFLLAYGLERIAHHACQCDACRRARHV